MLNIIPKNNCQRIVSAQKVHSRGTLIMTCDLAAVRWSLCNKLPALTDHLMQIETTSHLHNNTSILNLNMSTTQTGCKLNQLHTATTHPDPAENINYDKLFEVAKRMYGRYTALKSQVCERERQHLDNLKLMRKKYNTLKAQNKRLQNKHKLIKMYYTDVKIKLENLRTRQSEPEVQGSTAGTIDANTTGRPTCTQQ